MHAHPLHSTAPTAAFLAGGSHATRPGPAGSPVGGLDDATWLDRRERPATRSAQRPDEGLPGLRWFARFQLGPVWGSPYWLERERAGDGWPG